MTSTCAPCLLIGVDAGSVAAVSPLAAWPQFAPHDTHAPGAIEAEYWRDVYAARGAAGIVIGTSDSPAARRIESAARLAASQSGLKVVAIEDYAGNYFDVPGARTDLLIAESEFSVRLYRERLGAACPPLAIFCSARYDGYRSEAPHLRAATQAAWERHAAPAVLWAGQPESGDCTETLQRIAPALRAAGASVVIKAHPRDQAYATGIYAKLLDAAGIPHTDATRLDVAQGLALAPRLVITQFSSVAIEAGFYGIPALHLVYDDVGGARLHAKKGYGVPQYCLAGAGFYLQRRGGELQLLRAALLDAAARRSVIGCFDDFFVTRARVAPQLADHLVQVMGLARDFGRKSGA